MPYKNPIIISSDLHAHNYKAHAYMTEHGVNSRLLVCTSVLTQIGDFAEKEIFRGKYSGDDKVLHLFAGDLAHSRSSIDVAVSYYLRKAIDSLSSRGVDTKGIKGNHDMYLRSPGIHSLKIFEPSFEVIEGSHIYEVGGKVVQVFGISYDPDIESLESKLDLAKAAKSGDINILLIHHGISGAVVGPNDYKLKDELKKKHLTSLGYDWVFCGHYHTHQEIADGVVMVGSPLGHNFGERGAQDRGFLVVDLDEEIYDVIPVEAPQFRVFEVATKHLPKDWKHRLMYPDTWVGHYIKIVFKHVEAYTEFEPFIEGLTEDGVLSLTRELNTERQEAELRVEGIGHGISLGTMINSYVDKLGSEGLHDDLKEVGQMLLEEAVG